VPLPQTSPLVQALLSSQAVKSGSLRGSQAADVPLHVFGLLQFVSLGSPQGVVFGSKASTGHSPDVPVQFSAMSQVPTEARQLVVEDLNTSTHVFEPPEQ
jgi:hypothetical protein